MCHLGEPWNPSPQGCQDHSTQHSARDMEWDNGRQEAQAAPRPCLAPHTYLGRLQVASGGTLEREGCQQHPSETAAQPREPVRLK